MKTVVFDKLFGYFLSFTDTFQSVKSTPLRDARILNLQSTHSLLLPSKEDLFVGGLLPAPISFNPQETGAFPYNFQKASLERLLNIHLKNLSPEQLRKVSSAIEFWNLVYDNPAMQYPDSFPAEYRPTDILPDVNVLLEEGIYQARQMIEDSRDLTARRQAQLLTLTTIDQVLDFYKYHVCVLMAKYPNSRNIRTVFDILNWIKYRPPKTSLAKVQLYWLYAIVCRADESQIIKQFELFQMQNNDTALFIDIFMQRTKISSALCSEEP